MAIGPGGRSRTFAEINVTPLADVMIVLLVIAMVTVPALARGPVRTLPTSDAPRERRGPIEVSIAADGSVFLGAEALSVAGELLPRLRALLSEHGEGAMVVVKAEQRLRFAILEDVLRLCREAGAEELILATRARSPL
ncbi:MAG TPA: biopolymer transporter ExbD [Vicinamibacteria bacterium]|nr:biopolymer transporter ExbD [Vicinamibacteria bacterium]